VDQLIIIRIWRSGGNRYRVLSLRQLLRHKPTYNAAFGSRHTVGHRLFARHGLSPGLSLDTLTRSASASTAVCAGKIRGDLIKPDISETTRSTYYIFFQAGLRVVIPVFTYLPIEFLLSLDLWLWKFGAISCGMLLFDYRAGHLHRPAAAPLTQRHRELFPDMLDLLAGLLPTPD